ncbi:hypothetical protein JCM21900_003426 [Sporobolomyces salmonicolor]
MASSDDTLSQFIAVTHCSPDQAHFFMDSAGGDLQTAIATFFEPGGASAPASSNDDDAHGQHELVSPAPAGPQTLGGGPAAASTLAAPQPQQAQRSGAYTLSGEPAEPMPASWGGAAAGGRASGSSSRSSSGNPFRSNAGPRVTGFRDLASASSSGPSAGGFGGFGGGGAGAGDDSDEDEGRDPAHFFTGGAKSGLSVENPDDQRRAGGGAHGDMIRNILQQAREGANRLAGAVGGAARPSRASVFSGSAHTLGSDEMPSTYIPDPSKSSHPDEPEEEEEEDDEEVAVRTLTFWQDGFSVEDGELLKYEENQELLAAIQSGRAPLSLLKVRHDQPVELRIAKRMSEKWVRQPPPPAGPFAGHGNRLGSESPFPAGASTSFAPPSSSSMPGAMPGQPEKEKAGAAALSPDQVGFEVDRSAPTTQVQIRLRDGERMVATFNHSHTVGDIRRYINASRPGEGARPYALQTTFPSRDLADDAASLKDAGLLGSVVVQRGL